MNPSTSTQLTTPKRERVVLNGWEYWVDINKQILYDSETCTNGIHYDDHGVSIRSNHLTKNERQQLLDYLKYRK